MKPREVIKRGWWEIEVSSIPCYHETYEVRCRRCSRYAGPAESVEDAIALAQKHWWDRGLCPPCSAGLWPDQLVEVFVWNTESDTSWHEVHGELVCAHIPASRRRLGFCKADPEAVAELAGVEVEVAAEALARPGEDVLVGEIYQGDVSAKEYIVVYPVRNLSELEL